MSEEPIPDRSNDMEHDFLLQKVVEEILGRERDIINDFCKAFIAQKSLEGFPIATLFDHFQFCVKHDFDKEMKSTYWFEERDTKKKEKNERVDKC